MDSLVSRSKEGRKLMLAGIAANVVLALVKILGGLFGRSHALIADGIESSLDILSSAMMWGAIKYAGRPPDSDHPYGHGKMESLAAVSGAVLLILAGLSLGLLSIREIIHHLHSPGASGTPAPFTLLILAATILTKEALFRWLDHHGKKIGSMAVQVDALHHRSDALTSLAAGNRHHRNSPWRTGLGRGR